MEAVPVKYKNISEGNIICFEFEITFGFDSVIGANRTEKLSAITMAWITSSC